MQHITAADQLHDVLTKDRIALLRLAGLTQTGRHHKGQHQKVTGHIDSLGYQQLFAKSHAAFNARKQALPAITFAADLPVSQHVETLRVAIEQHQVIIVAGETGSGKTTQLPKIAMLAGRGIAGVIAHTQPRRIAARSVAERIAFELGEPLGGSVGYKVRFNEIGNRNAHLRLMTDGILLAELAVDRYLNQYDTIIIDEAHERSLNIDFLLGCLKTLLAKRPDLKLIITSATLDVARFSRYFGQAPVICIEGRSFPVEVRYCPILDDAVGGSDDDAFDTIEELLPRAVVQAVEACFVDARSHGHTTHTDILVFASTEREIHDLQDAIHKYGPKHTTILPLYARLALSEQQKIFSTQLKDGGGRRIIIATNVAETALTVPNIRYVIDTGFARVSRYSYRSRVQRLPIEAISQASANQRKGRCGRVAAGVCIRLYSEVDFLSRPEYTEPEIKRTNLASVILQMAQLKVGDIDQFDFIEPPDSRLVNDGIKLLLELGALKENKTHTGGRYLLTPTGKQMASMPIDPRLSRMLVGGATLGALSEMLVIVSALAVQDPRERPQDKKAQADQKHALFKQPNSDFLFYLQLWQALTSSELNSQRKKRDFAREHFLSWLRISEWQQTHRQLTDYCLRLGLTVNETPADYAAIHQSLLLGLLSYIAKRTEDNSAYVTVKQQKAKIFPASTVHKQNQLWVTAFEIVETSHVYLRCVAKIEPEWIVASAGNQLKYHYFEPHWSKKTGRVHAYVQISLYGLIVQSRQLCIYETLNTSEANEIFVRDAIVQQKLGVEAAFFAHNHALVESIVNKEDKLRRRDLLVDDDDIMALYMARIPQDICNRKQFEVWRKHQEIACPQFLFFSEADLIRRETVLDDTAYPDMCDAGALKLPARYVFDPSSQNDGMVVTVPVQALPQVDMAALSFGVPAWRGMLLEALLKSLPKEQRKRLVPIPDTVAKIIPLLNHATSTGLPQQIIQALKQVGFEVQTLTSAHFNISALPSFLRPTIEVVDTKQRVLATGKDVVQLQEQTQQFNRSGAASNTAAQELTAFPLQFTFKQNTHIAGVSLAQYSAITPVYQQENSPHSGLVKLQLQQFNDETLAKATHRHGVVHLLASCLGDVIKQLKKNIPKTLMLAYAPLGNSIALEQLVCFAVIDCCVVNTPYTNAAFMAVLSDIRPQILLQAHTVIKQLLQIFEGWRNIKQMLHALDNQVFARAIDDVSAQIEALALADFVYQIDSQYWQQYPRYVAAMAVRLERLPNNLAKDMLAIDCIQPYINKLEGKWLQPSLAAYRWLLEEYRIALFAQPMKTHTPASAIRLDKLWQAAQNGN